MNIDIKGSDIQMAVIELNKDEFVHAEVGSMFYIKGDIDMDIKVPGGWVGGLKRMFLGESFVLPVFISKEDNTRISFSPSYPGKIIKLNVNESKSWLAQKSSFLFSTGNIGINISFIKKFRAGFFGGEGFILQKFFGNGDVFIHCGGLAVEKELKEGESLKIDTGCIAAFEETVGYDVKRVKNVKTAFFGGEGFFLSTLTGPGKVILQSLPLSRFQATLFGTSNSTNPLADFGRIIGGD